ncbi:MAG: hypothetical protein R2822_10065 [Spirosomataceae bacterium]
MLDRKIPMPTTIYPSDSVKTVPKGELKAQVPGGIAFASGFVAVILVFVGATVGVIVLGAIAIIMGIWGKSIARKLTENRQKLSPTSSASKVKSGGANFGIVVGILTIVVALALAFWNGLMSWGG